jgi:hypothetical protein
MIRNQSASPSSKVFTTTRWQVVPGDLANNHTIAKRLTANRASKKLEKRRRGNKLFKLG